MSATPLPPDVQAARKARINRDIIRLCSKPAPSYPHPAAHGIGLYTHVAAPKTTARNAHNAVDDRSDAVVALLPMGGPGKIQPSKLRAPPNGELAAIYKELQDAVEAEGKTWSDQSVATGKTPKNMYRISLDTLKKKYGEINAQPSDSATPQLNNRSQDKRRHSEGMRTANDEAFKKSTASFAPQSEPRRQSATDLTTGKRGADVARRGSRPRPSNDYDIYRDPRRQRR